MSTAELPRDIRGRITDIQWVCRTRRPPSSSLMSRTMTIADLFCGCGGLTLGACEAARQSGIQTKIALAVDLSRNALAVYQNNFLRSGTQQEDLSLLLGSPGESILDSERRLSASVKSISLMLAGPPCQGHSDLNNSSRRHDPRNLLYLKVVRAAELFRPSVVLIENVPTVVHDKTNVVRRAKEWLCDFGYNVDDGIVSALRVGVPQNRRRHILVGSLAEKFCVAEFAKRWICTASSA